MLGWLWGELPAIPGDLDWELPHPAGLQPAGKALSPSMDTGHWENGRFIPNWRGCGTLALRDALGTSPPVPAAPKTAWFSPRSLNPPWVLLDRILEGSGRAFPTQGSLHGMNSWFLTAPRRLWSHPAIPGVCNAQMINKSPQSVFLQRFLPLLNATRPQEHQGRGRAGIKGKLGHTTLLDVRSPLISQTFPIRKKKPAAFAYQKRIFDLSPFMLLSLPSPPSLGGAMPAL